jgi:hypothetical protein
METTIPFSGFYESDHDSLLESALEQLFSDQNGDPLPCAGDAWGHIDWTKVQAEYAEEYARQFAALLSDVAGFPIRLPLVELNSPRSYKFTTDRIFCKVSQRTVKALHKLADKAKLDKLIHDKFTSYDGFLSYYDNSLTAWPKNPLEWDANQIGTLLESVFFEHFDRSNFNAWEIMEGWDGNGGPSNLLYDALDAEGRALLESERPDEQSV